MILIISHKNDFTADFVINKLNNQSIPYKRINTEDIFDYNISLSIHNNFFKLNISEVQKINSVWFRRTKMPIIQNVDAYTRHYIERELDSFFDNLWNVIDARWLSYPESIYKAESKLLQLREAIDLGFLVPDTLVSANSFDIENFYHKHSGDIIIKPLSNGRFESSEGEKLIFTNKVKEEHILNIKNYASSMSIYQKYIDKTLEIRVTVVGDDVFAASVESQNSEITKVDWRRDKLKFVEYDLPVPVKDLCQKLVKKLSLSFGAIDLILDKEGNYVFLEINPNGQWAWIEVDTGLQISDSIIKFLK